MHWDIQNKAISSSQTQIFFVLDVPARSLLSIIVDFIPCGRLLQRTNRGTLSRSNRHLEMLPLLGGVGKAGVRGNNFLDNLVPRASPLYVPGSERGKTLVGSGHVSPREKLDPGSGPSLATFCQDLFSTPKPDFRFAVRSPRETHSTGYVFQ